MTSREDWKDALTGRMEERIVTLESDIVEIRNGISSMQPDIMTKPSADHVHRDPILQFEFCENCLPKSLYPTQAYDHLIEVITVAFKGLKPDATINQQNIAYYAVRRVLNIEEKKK